MNESGNTKQSIEELKKRYENLHRKKIQAEANLDNAKKQLEELKQQARKEYGTDEIEALKKKLAEMQAENERRQSEYQQQLSKVESDLAAVEEKYKHADAQNSRS
ncbi:MAG: hypothetical protein ACLFUY_10320 [Desulfobacterales bacterium]